jgi:hypothetical protein
MASSSSSAAAKQQHQAGVTLTLDPKSRAALVGFLDGTSKTVDPAILVALKTATEEATKAMRAREEAEREQKVAGIKAGAQLLQETIAKEYPGVTQWAVAKAEGADDISIKVRRGEERVLSIGGGVEKGGGGLSRKERREKRKAAEKAAAATA